MNALDYDNVQHRRIGMKRLEKVAALLEKLPPERFFYGTWAGTEDKPWKGAQDLSCGTTACAMGWACTIPSLRDRRRAGLRLETCNWDLKKAMVCNVNGANDYDAAQQAFALTVEEAEYLFQPNDSRLGVKASAFEVARHIRRFIAAGGIP